LSTIIIYQRKDNGKLLSVDTIDWIQQKHQTSEMFSTVMTVSGFSFVKTRQTPRRATSRPSVTNTFILELVGWVAARSYPKHPHFTASRLFYDIYTNNSDVNTEWIHKYKELQGSG